MAAGWGRLPEKNGPACNSRVPVVVTGPVLFAHARARPRSPRPPLGLSRIPGAPAQGARPVARGTERARRVAHWGREVAVLPGARAAGRRAHGRRLAAHFADAGSGARPR